MEGKVRRPGAQRVVGLRQLRERIGSGLSVDRIDGTEGLEERGKQDAGQKATTSASGELLSQTRLSTDKPGKNGGQPPPRRESHNGASAGKKQARKQSVHHS